MPPKNRTRIGYARVSTADQNPELQLDALAAAGCEKVFTDNASGAKSSRPGLNDAKEYLRDGDILIVWRLDRLGRSLKDLVETIGWLEDRGIGFVSLTESIDTSTAGGKLIFHIFGSLAEFERELIRERTHAGLASARARGRKGGRPSVMDANKTRLARRLLEEKDAHGNAASTVTEVAATLGVSRASLYRALEREAAKGN